MRLLTWNVNGARARAAEIVALLTAERPDVVALQELKATPAQLPDSLLSLPGYRGSWHGAGPYSGVALLLRDQVNPDGGIGTVGGGMCGIGPPTIDREQRMLVAEVGGLQVASVYAPNGGRDFAAKLDFYADLIRWSREAAQRCPLVLLGDLNIAREERDVHPKERKLGAIGQRPEERELFAQLLAEGGLADSFRELAPDDDALFTWWAPWRNLRQRNIGWRIDYALVGRTVASRPSAARVLREFGSSDHAPLIIDLG